MRCLFVVDLKMPWRCFLTRVGGPTYESQEAWRTAFGGLPSGQGPVPFETTLFADYGPTLCAIDMCFPP
jgi:hypothetical protein